MDKNTKKELDDLFEFIERFPQEQLNEIIKIDKNTKVGANLNTEFSIGKYQYKYDAQISLLQDDKTKLEFKFYTVGGDREPLRQNFDSDAQHTIAVKRYRTSVIGTEGNQFKVFSKVLSLVYNNIIVHKPDYITFVANEKNRQSLYSKFINHLQKELEDVKYERIYENPELRIETEDEEFWFKKVV